MRSNPEEPLSDPLLAALRQHVVETPLGPEQFDVLVETHTAWVLLGTRLAIKIRKPVNLGFLDYSSGDLRERAARSEVEIGQRISPHVYYGVWSITEGTDDRMPTLMRSAGAGEPVVAMKRLDDSLRLDRIVTGLTMPLQRIDEVALECARFHGACAVDRRVNGWGAVANTVAAWTVNFEQMPAAEPSVPLTIMERRQLIEETDEWLCKLRPILEQRIESGCVRDGHGDLRAEHIYLTTPWSVLDPLEFSTVLRFTDVAAEVCFLAMELAALGRPDASARFLSTYATATYDETLSVVTPFFVRYRAVVRGKVAWIRAMQLPEEQRDPFLAESRRFFELALAA
jgi:hypothetical protein